MGYTLGGGGEKRGQDHPRLHRNIQGSPELRLAVSLLEGGELARLFWAGVRSPSVAPAQAQLWTTWSSGVGVVAGKTSCC